MIDQEMGGDIVYIVSKNAFFAGPNNVAYGASKADQAHQVRLLAAELGAFGIRVNGVNPDGVVRGSGHLRQGLGRRPGPDLRHPRGQARRVLRPADAAQARGPARARRGRGLRPDRRRPEPDHRPAHPRRRRRRGRVPAVTARARSRPSTSARRAGASWSGGSGPTTLELDEVHRFPNDPVALPDGLHWDILRALPRDPRRAARGGRAAAGDLRRRRGRLVGRRLRAARRGRARCSATPFHYRDARTERRRRRSTPSSRPTRLYARTGHPVPAVQHALPARRGRAARPRFAAARTMLLIPDLIGYWLSGRRSRPRRRTRRRPGCSTSRRADVGDGPDRRARPAGDRSSRRLARARRRRRAAARRRRAPRPGCRPATLVTLRRVARHGVGGRRRAGRRRRVRLHRLRDLGAGRRRARRADPDRGEPRGELHQRARRGRPDPLPAQRHGPVAAPGVAADVGARPATPDDLPALLAAAAELPAGGPTIDPNDPALPAAGRHAGPDRRAPAGGRPGRPPTSRPALVRCILDSLAAAFAATVRDAVAAVRPDGRGRPRRRRRQPATRCSAS